MGSSDLKIRVFLKSCELRDLLKSPIDRSVIASPSCLKIVFLLFIFIILINLYLKVNCKIKLIIDINFIIIFLSH